MYKVGDVIISTRFGEFVVIQYESSVKIKIRFTKTGYETLTTSSRINKGLVKDRFSPTVGEVGVVGETQVLENGKIKQSYQHWKSMLERCYSVSLKTKYPSYQNCVSSETFKYYEEFDNWCQKQTGFNNKGWCLDKDILFRGNKVYSENTCCFVPSEINVLINNNPKFRNPNFPLGVRTVKGTKRFSARIKKYGKEVHIGMFDTIEEAFYAYKSCKESYIKEVANKWKDQIDPRVYDALIKWEIDIHD